MLQKGKGQRVVGHILLACLLLRMEKAKRRRMREQEDQAMGDSPTYQPKYISLSFYF